MGLLEKIKEIMCDNNVDTEFEDGVQSFFLEDYDENIITLSVNQVDETFTFNNTAATCFDMDIIKSLLNLLINEYDYRYVDEV